MQGQLTFDTLNTLSLEDLDALRKSLELKMRSSRLGELDLFRLTHEHDIVSGVIQVRGSTKALHLPPEILAQIFIFYRDICGTEASPFALARVLKMLHVCAFWRQVALGSQALWARVHFFCPQKALRAGTQAGLELWLKRAGGHRISLAFTCPRQHITVQDDGDVSCSDILRMLLLCSAKWRNLHLSVSKSCKLEDQPLAGLSFQTLEMVRFSADQHTSPAIHKMLSAGTRLTSLDIDIVDCDRRRVADILGVLTATPSLATLTIAGKDDCLSPTHWINEILHKIEDSLTFVPHLRCLSLRLLGTTNSDGLSCAFLNCLRQRESRGLKVSIDIVGGQSSAGDTCVNTRTTAPCSGRQGGRAAK